MVLTVWGRVGLVDDGQHVGLAGDGDDVGRVAASRALGVVGVDAPAGDGGEGRLHEPGLVEGVGVDGRPARPTRRTPAGRRRWRPASVPQSSCSLKPDGPRPQLLPHPLGGHGVALAQQGDVDRPPVERLEHPGQVPGAGRDGGGLGALGRAGAAADDRGDPAAERLLEDLGADEVDVAVDGAGGEDAPVAGDDLGGRADDQRRVDPVHGVGVAGLAQPDDAPVADADVGLHHAPVVEDDGPGDDGVGRPLGPGGPALAHRLPDDLAPAEHGLVAARRTGPPPPR